jgi:hypothetical protein
MASDRETALLHRRSMSHRYARAQDDEGVVKIACHGWQELFVVGESPEPLNWLPVAFQVGKQTDYSVNIQ